MIVLIACYLDFIALISLLLRLSALEFCSDITAQIAAGIQPIKVICRIKHRIDVSIRPRKKKERNGKNIAINVIIFLICPNVSNYGNLYKYKINCLAAVIDYFLIRLPAVI
ncbi:hypothetical protein [Flavobacterium aquicola]|uniref:Uncharacterized protein n=1 Tax=Flavobacterium aquicola TaxID=1682742 RepID=A0A3E0EPK9_9FLAO|nr:hypothetical protein C8P67_104290 [Flavobacterium aquicola]